jgi:hypothetical protein
MSSEVSPSELEFSEKNQRVSFTMTVSGVALEEGQVYSFTILWYNNEHKVSSPVVVYRVHNESTTDSQGWHQTGGLDSEGGAMQRLLA